MIPPGLEIYFATFGIDLRWGFDRLSGIVQERMGRGVRSRALFVFIGRRRTGLKILYHDGTGLCLFYKRLDRGTFKLPVLPSSPDGALEISEATLMDLVDGLSVEEDVPRFH